MGRVLNIFTRIRRKHRTKRFELNDVPLHTPQSALDKRIFYPNWIPRPEWKHYRGKDFVGNSCWIFESPDDPDLRLDEMQLKLYRNRSFRPVFKNGTFKYEYEYYRDPPLEWITSPAALEEAKPECVGRYI